MLPFGSIPFNCISGVSPTAALLPQPSKGSLQQPYERTSLIAHGSASSGTFPTCIRLWASACIEPCRGLDPAGPSLLATQLFRQWPPASAEAGRADKDYGLASKTEASNRLSLCKQHRRSRCRKKRARDNRVPSPKEPTMQKFIIGATAALIATVSRAATAQAGWKHGKKHGWKWKHGHHNNHHGIKIYSGYNDGYCFVKKIKKYDDWGNVYSRRSASAVTDYRRSGPAPPKEPDFSSCYPVVRSAPQTRLFSWGTGFVQTPRTVS